MKERELDGDEVIYGRFDEVPQEKGQFMRIRHIPTGVEVMEVDDFELCRSALWGMKHVIAPESFIRIDIAPGETQMWTRKYVFSNRN